MGEKKPFSDRRWHDAPEATVISHRELTEEEQRQADKDLEEFLKEDGFMKSDESLADWRRKEQESKNK